MANHSLIAAFMVPVILVFSLGFCAATEVTFYDFYKLNVTVDMPNQTVFAPGSTISYTVTAHNQEDYLFDGYLIVTQVYGCDIPSPYNIKISDCDTVVSKTIRKVRMDAGTNVTWTVDETVPADARPGTWRLDTYLMMNNTQVDGNYIAYTPRQYFAFNVTGSGSSPKVSILKSKTHVAGGFTQSGPAVPQESAIKGYVELKNLDDKDFAGTLEISYCTFDDYMGNCNTSETVDINIPVGTTFGKVYEITDRLERGIYTIFYRVLESGKEVSEYKNRLIVSGKTINIVSINGYKESYVKGERPQVRVAFTGPYFPALDVVKNIVAKTSVYDAAGKLIYNITENYDSIKPDDIKIQQYAFAAQEDIAGYTACLDVAGDGASKKECTSFGNMAATPVQTESATPQPTAAQATPIASETPIATPAQSTGQEKDNAIAYTAIIVAIAALAAYWLFKNQKPPVSAAILLLIAVLPLANAVNCPAFAFNYDGNNNGVVNAGDKALPSTGYHSGPKYYLPLNTIVTASGQCDFTYAVTVYDTSYYEQTQRIHWCGNTASHYVTTTVTVSTPREEIRTGYYTHYLTVSMNPITFTNSMTYSLNTSNVTKPVLVELIKNYTYTNLSFSNNASKSIYASLLPANLPAFTFAQNEYNTSKVDSYIMYSILHNHCSVAANNCTYNNETSAYGVYTYRNYSYVIRNFTINGYTLLNLPVNYTHVNGTMMRLKTNVTLNNYRVDNYSVPNPVAGAYAVNYSLRNYVYTYSPNATNTYSYTLPLYYVAPYTVNGYVVDTRTNTTDYYIKWESLFVEMSNQGLLEPIVTPTDRIETGSTSIKATNVNTYKILTPGIYYLAHTYA